jgi:hypothetical protein
MIDVLVYSRDRACQLDLLLLSLEENAPGMFEPITVIWVASTPEFADGYYACKYDHPEAQFIHEPAGLYGLQRMTREVLKRSGPLIMFAMDDDVLYRSLEIEPWPESLMANHDVFCVSLRLGQQTNICYPHTRKQELPHFTWVEPNALTWEWRGADGDFGYPCSLDGHIFRTHQVLARMGHAEFLSPNQLEDVLASQVQWIEEPLMACYQDSHLVSIPANRVSQTHTGNRYGNTHSTVELNDRFLLGERLSLWQMMKQEHQVTGAHTELEMLFK